MKTWEAIRADTADTGEGCLFVKNAYYHLDGELQRRHGMANFATQSGTSLRGFRNAIGQRFAVFVTSAGAVVSVDA